MKHTSQITIILISMFIITQLIGLFVISIYNHPDITLPYGMEPPEEMQASENISSILFAFIIAISLFILLTKLKADTFIRFWFFLVTIIALGLTINAFFYNSDKIFLISIISLVIAIPLAFFKIYKRNLIIHNLTELLIYPGIAAVFVPILNIMGLIILLLVISLYDIWAVWQSEFMQKMAKYQINNLKIFAGFFVPYASKKQKQKIQKIKQKYSGKSEKEIEKQFKKAKIKINLAILGGGDVIFPIIAAGVFFKVIFEKAGDLGITLFSPFILAISAALMLSLSATLALSLLFILARKGKFYPAMPFITIGLYLGIIVLFLLDLILRLNIFIA